MSTSFFARPGCPAREKHSLKFLKEKNGFQIGKNRKKMAKQKNEKLKKRKKENVR